MAGEMTSKVVDVVTSLPSRKRGMVEEGDHSRAPWWEAPLVAPLAAMVGFGFLDLLHECEGSRRGVVDAFLYS